MVDTVIDGSDGQDVLGGGVGIDIIHGGDGDDVIHGDTRNSNPTVPLGYTTVLDGLPFSAGNLKYSINGTLQPDGLAIGSGGSAVLNINPELVTGDDLEVQVTGIITEFQYEFFDLVPEGRSARNIPETGADFTGTASDLNVRALALDLTGSHDTYSVRYTSEIFIEDGGTYTFSTRSDDGSLLFIDGEEVVSNDGLHGARTRSGDIELGPGTHSIEIVFFENRGGDVLEVSLAGPDTNGETIDIVESGQVGEQVTFIETIPASQIEVTGLLPGLQYEFFDSVPAGYTVFNIPQTDPDFTGVAETLDVSALAQELTGSRETYAVRYTGDLFVGEAGEYDFSSLSDDGFALLIDGEVVIVNDGLHAPSVKDGKVELASGIHAVEVVFFENTGQDVLNITMSGPDTGGVAIDLFSSPNIGHRGQVEVAEGDRDFIEGGAGADVIDGGASDEDVVSFRSSEEGVHVNLAEGTGTGGDAEGDTYLNVEFAHGSNHDDTLIGDDEVNRLVGLDGNDRLVGAGGDDTLIGGRGGDYIDGGEGVDTVEYDWSNSGVVVDLSTGVGSGAFAEGDTLVNVENLLGSNFADILTGDTNSNRLNGNGGDDTLDGGAGNDILVGGLGADTLVGGSGDRDAADYSGSSQGVTVDLENGGSGGDAEADTFSGIEFVYGSQHDDTIIGDDANNRLVGKAGDDAIYGGDGRDYLVGGAGADFLHGGAGNADTVEYRQAETGVGVNLQTGGFAGEATGDTFVDVEYVYGSDFADEITGNDDANRLIGFGGDDIIDGGLGNDYIIGMSDNDILTGGAGNDVFLYKDLFGDDRITDFEAGAGRTDRIWLDLAGIQEMDDLTITDQADGALITVGSYGTILLEGLVASDLNSDDFIF